MGKGFGWLLILAVMAIEIPRFVGAYNGIDRGAVSAVATGIVLPAGSMYVFHAWLTSTRKHRHVLLAWFGLNMALAVFILVPWAVGQVQGQELTGVLGHWVLVWSWSFVVIASPFVLAGGITNAIAFQVEHRAPRKHLEVPERKEESKLDGTDLALLREWGRDPGCTLIQAGEAAGISKSTASRRRDVLEQEGHLRWDGKRVTILHGNGKEPS